MFSALIQDSLNLKKNGTSYYSLPPLISTRTPDGIFLLMLGIQARIVPWTITNNIGVDAKRDFSI